jgi:hypothetical protein
MKRTSYIFFIFSLISFILLVKISPNEDTPNKVISAEQAEDLRQKEKRRREREVSGFSFLVLNIYCFAQFSVWGRKIFLAKRAGDWRFKEKCWRMRETKMMMIIRFSPNNEF